MCCSHLTRRDFLGAAATGIAGTGIVLPNGTRTQDRIGWDPEKPFLKAGRRHYARKARNKLYPLTRASAMNVVDHPFGNTRTSRKAKQKGASKFAPPGRKVGKLWPKKTGKRN